MRAIKYKGRLYSLNDGRSKFRFSKNDPEIKKAASQLLKDVRRAQRSCKNWALKGKMAEDKDGNKGDPGSVTVYAAYTKDAKIMKKLLAKVKASADKLRGMKIAGFYKSLLRKGIKDLSRGGDMLGALWQLECVYHNLKEGPSALEEAKDELYYA